MNPIPQFLTPGRYTVFTIFDWMAHTQKMEIELLTTPPELEFRPDHVNAPRGRHRLGTFKQRGKRKQFFLDVKLHGTLIFAGWDLDLLTDSEWSERHRDPGSNVYHAFSGNACFNLGGTVAHVRAMIDAGNRNPHFTQWDAVLTHDEQPVYPETPTSHSVVQRIREKLAA
jgi:hypothetical protein